MLWLVITAVMVGNHCCYGW